MRQIADSVGPLNEQVRVSEWVSEWVGFNVPPDTA